MYKLFYFPRNASWAPHMLMQQMGLNFELALVDRKTQAQKSADYLKLNPTGRIPTLVDGEQIIFESGAICLHLCDKHPEHNLLPQVGDHKRAECLQWLFYLTSSLQPELMPYFYPDRHTQDGVGVEQIKAAQESRVGEMFSLIDNHLNNNAYLLGDQITVADFFLFMLAHWASGFAKSPKSYSHLGRFMREFSELSSVKAVADKEGTDLSMYR